MKPLKLCLLQPPIEDFYDTTIRLQPLGLCYLKAAVRRAFPKMDVIVQDYHHDRGRATVPLPRELAYLRPYYAYPDRSPFAVFYQYYHFGAPVDTLADEVAAAAGISRSTLAMRFRTALRRTVKEEIDRVRVARAIVLLTARKMSVTDVALAIGCSDSSHFTRLFRRVTGRRPFGYQQQET